MTPYYRVSDLMPAVTYLILILLLIFVSLFSCSEAGVRPMGGVTSDDAVFYRFRKRHGARLDQSGRPAVLSWANCREAIKIVINQNPDYDVIKMGGAMPL